MDRVPSRAVEDEPEIADDFVVADAVENERGTRIVTVWQTRVASGAAPALGGEANPDHPLGRPAAQTPQPAALTGRAVVLLARLGFPGSRARGAAAQLDDVRPRRIDRRHPVEAIAAQVHQPPTVLEIVHVRAVHGAGDILGVAAGEHDAVTSQQVPPLTV